MDLSSKSLDFRGKRVLVLGDVMLDTFVYGQCARISPEAPIPVIRIEREDVMLGGAGNVARNIAALGGEAVLIGIIGEDAAGAMMLTKVAAEPGIFADFVNDGRPTTQKIRYVAAQQQMLRADIEHSFPAGASALLAAFDRQIGTADVVVLSDYAKGVLSRELLAQVIQRAREAGKPVIADPKSAEIGRYDGVTLLTPNIGETILATGIACVDDGDVERAAQAMLAVMPNTVAVLVTRSAKGMTLVLRDGTLEHHPAMARQVFDVSGAGDTVVAALALSLAAGLSLADAAALANAAAGKAVSKPGTAVVSREELEEELHVARPGETTQKIVTLAEAVAIVGRWRSAGDRIGFTNGCFDLIHPGHVSQLTQARAACDRLIVGLNTEDSIGRLKGPGRPVQNDTARAIVLASLVPVDLVVLFADDTPLRLIEAIRPDVLVKGKDYTVEQVIGSDVVLEYGGEVLLADLLPGHSTTDIIARLTK